MSVAQNISCYKKYFLVTNQFTSDQWTVLVNYISVIFEVIKCNVRYKLKFGIKKEVI